MAEGAEHTKGAELAAGYVSVDAKTEDARAKVRGIYTDADKAAKEHADNAGKSITQALTRAGSDAPKGFRGSFASGMQSVMDDVGPKSANTLRGHIVTGVIAGLNSSDFRTGFRDSIEKTMDQAGTQGSGAFQKSFEKGVVQAFSSFDSSARASTDAHSAQLAGLMGDYDALGGRISAARSEVERMKDAAKNVDSIGADIDGGSFVSPAKILLATTALAGLETEQKKVGEEIKKVNADVKDGVDKTRSVFDSIRDHLGGAGGKLKEAFEGAKEGVEGLVNKTKEGGEALTTLGDEGGEAGGKLAGIAEAIGGIVTDPIVLATAAIVGLVAGTAEVISKLNELGEDFEETFNSITIQTGATGEQMEGLKENVLNIAGSIGLPMEKIGQDVGSVFQQFGDSGPDLEKVATAVGKAQASFGQFDLRSLGKDVRAFNLDANGQVNAINTLAAANQKTGITFDELSSSVAQLAPISKAFNLNFDQTAGLLTSFEKAGVDPSKVFTSLTEAQRVLAKGDAKKGIAGISDPAALNKQLVDVLNTAKQLSDSGDVAGATKKLSDLFGQQSTRGGPDTILSVLQHGFDPSNFAASIGQVDGLVDGLYDRTTTYQSMWQEVKNSISAALEPAADAIHAFVANGLMALSGWVKDHKSEILTGIIEIAQGGIAALQGLGDVVGRVTQALSGTLAAVGHIVNGLSDIQGWRGDTDGAKKTRELGTALVDAGHDGEDFGKKFAEMGDKQLPKLWAALDKAKDDIAHGITPNIEDLTTALGGVEKPANEAGGAVEGAGNQAAGANAPVKTLADNLAALKSPPPINVTATVNAAAGAGVTATADGLSILLGIQTGGALPLPPGVAPPPVATAPGQRAQPGPAGGVLGNLPTANPAPGSQGPNALPGQAIGPDGLIPNPTDVQRNPISDPLGALTGPQTYKWKDGTLHNKPDPSVRQNAAGGAVDGPGAKGVDSVLSWLAPGEHVVTADEVDAVGGQNQMYHLRAAMKSGALPAFAGGGAVGPDVSYAKSLVGTPYSKGARNDCSGMVGRVVEGVTGQGGGLPTTQNMGSWLAARGFVSGLGPPGTVSVGWYNHGSGENDGHAAMTLSDGENAESGGSHGDFIVGPGAAGAGSSEFDQHMYLPTIYGEGAAGSGGVSGGLGGSGGNVASAAQVASANEAVTNATGAVQVATQKLQEATGAPLATNKDGTLSKGAQEAHDKAVTAAQAKLDAANRDLDTTKKNRDNLLDGGSSAAVAEAQNAVTNALNRQADAQAKLDAVQADPKSKPSDITAAQNALAESTQKVTDAQTKLQAAQSKPAKGDKNDPVTALANAGGDFLKGNLPPGFSDPTSWPLVKTASNALKFFGGLTKDPTAKAILGAGGSALGGDAGGTVTSLLSAFPKPFGQVSIGSPVPAPGGDDDLGPAVPGGDGGLPPMPNIPGLPTDAPPPINNGDTNIDLSSNIQGDVGHTSAATAVMDRNAGNQARGARIDIPRVLKT